MHKTPRLTQEAAAHMGYEMLADYRRSVRRERNARYLKKNRPQINSKKMFLALHKYQKGLN